MLVLSSSAASPLYGDYGTKHTQLQSNSWDMVWKDLPP